VENQYSNLKLIRATNDLKKILEDLKLFLDSFQFFYYF